MILIISSSLNPNSNSRIIAKSARRELDNENHPVALMDLQDFDLPFCDGDSCYKNPVVKEVRQTIESANSILCVTPVYNYDVNASLKNLVELTGKAWESKTVGLACVSGGKGSYMSPVPFLNSLMLDFRCRIIPRYVHATESAFTDGVISDQDLIARIKGLTGELINSQDGGF